MNHDEPLHRLIDLSLCNNTFYDDLCNLMFSLMNYICGQSLEVCRLIRLCIRMGNYLEEILDAHQTDFTIPGIALRSEVS